MFVLPRILPLRLRFVLTLRPSRPIAQNADAEAQDSDSPRGLFAGSLLCCCRPFRGDAGNVREVVAQAPYSTDSVSARARPALSGSASHTRAILPCDFQDLRSRHEFMSNYVATTRYTWWNFIFKVRCPISIAPHFSTTNRLTHPLLHTHT